MNSEGDSLAACNSLPHLMCTRLLYSGQFSKGPIFGKGHLQRSNFREWPFLSEILVPEKTSAPFSSECSVSITRFTSALVDSMDNDGTVIDSGSGSLVVSLDTLKSVTDTFL